MTDQLPDNLLGGTSTTNMKFTLDDSGYAKVQKSYTTVGSKVSVTGTVTDPDGFWDVEVSSSAGSDHKYSSIATGQSEDFDLKTNFGSTTVTLKITATNGASSAGISGHINISYKV
jgi:hypothetical protein|tara:strand:+ start:374 stop:721 length:348 start_codon:yes stop_codon:yes gene_type:complete